MSLEPAPSPEQVVSPEQVDHRLVWEALLDSLEHDAARQAADPTAVVGWSEPAGLGPVPRELVGRASRLLAAQRDRIAELESDRRATLEHLGALRAVDATREPRGAVYLDASA
ncbi:hypothetical protein EDF31_108153 [Curtobacterium sp. PhB142]|uniref:hypothetical protein n=1 Tax=unclassified Curtobacterium TaxID=257496 RepID=UPI00104D5516|nr:MULTISPECIES: hypothetical protein [unclassified Curtobacterium]TCL82901.1 hypothetical protein EDF31_108153 [Curtobacterium sp. PhB142]TCM00665.1 hypothetical protein EDF26_108153 [Curtobacterium sp. PhB134]TDW74404.1 hypothetical protein EDF51_101414 [Curtobacterium sp. PhB25]